MQGPFDEAIASAKELSGVTVPKGSAEQLVREAAVDFDDYYAQRVPAPADRTGPIVVVGGDGKGVPMVKPEKNLRVVRRGKGEKANKKRMATVAVVFTKQPRVRTPEEVVESLFDEKPKLVGAADPPRHDKPEHKRVWASLTKSKDEVIAEAAAEAARRNPDKTKTVVAVCDGERALQRRLQLMLTAVAAAGLLVVVLDFPHVLEKLWKAAYCFHPEGSDEAKAWVPGAPGALRLLRGEVSQVVKGIRQSATKRGLTGAKRAPGAPGR